jgi:hypothetical protein
MSLDFIKIGQRVRIADRMDVDPALRGHFGTIEEISGDHSFVKIGKHDSRGLPFRHIDLRPVDYRKPYQNALGCQDACSLSGVVHSLSRDLETIWDEVRANAGGTAEVNRHPAVQLYVAKLTELAGVTGGSLSENYEKAEAICKAKASEVSQ